MIAGPTEGTCCCLPLVELEVELVTVSAVALEVKHLNVARARSQYSEEKGA